MSTAAAGERAKLGALGFALKAFGFIGLRGLGLAASKTGW